MKILGIETSCDETAISIIEVTGDPEESTITVLANVVHSQIEIHKKYGGVFPALAKREHAKNLIPVLGQALSEAQLEKITLDDDTLSEEDKKLLAALLEREPELYTLFLDYLPTIETPDIDAIAVTYGPGLEPALWVGVNFAKALSTVWNKPVVPVNHMEGHIFSGLLEKKGDETFTLGRMTFPLMTLLISGGHTELTLMNDWLDYTVIGETRDDAVGEAFDKVARMLDLPYPGGPEIAAYADTFDPAQPRTITLPRPMLARPDFDFSFSGLKTAVLTLIKKTPTLTDALIAEMSYEFQEAATEVLVKKTMRAVEEYGAEALVVGGGVSANKRIRHALATAIQDYSPSTTLFLPEQQFTTDNGLMIALAGYVHMTHGGVVITTPEALRTMSAHGTLRLDAK